MISFATLARAKRPIPDQPGLTSKTDNLADGGAFDNGGPDEFQPFSAQFFDL